MAAGAYLPVESVGDLVIRSTLARKIEPLWELADRTDLRFPADQFPSTVYFRLPFIFDGDEFDENEPHHENPIMNAVVERRAGYVPKIYSVRFIGEGYVSRHRDLPLDTADSSHRALLRMQGEFDPSGQHFGSISVTV